MTIKSKSSSQYVLDSSREYSLYVCSNRAIPRVSDGLKDGQRKAMWLLRNKASKIKTVSLAGELISSNLYVHGDASASAAISMLAAPYVNNVPLIEGIGTFGTRVAPTEGIASPRYTYVKRSKASDDFFFNDLPVVPMKENYDGSVMEPETFLPLIPTVLLNGVSGIAVGWSTEILPRKFADLKEATLKVIDGVNIRRIKPGYSYLDVEVLHLEDNSWEFIGKATVTDASTVTVTELPPDLNLEKFKDRLNKMEEEGQIRNYIDRSTDSIEVAINVGRGQVKGWSENKALNFFKLKQKKTERIVVIDWDGKAIRQYENAEDIIKDFVDWRLGHYTKRYEKLLEDAEYEIKFWKGVKECFDQKLPSTLGAIASRQAIETKVQNITKALKIEPAHIDRIVNLSTYRWAKDYYKTVTEKIKELNADIKLYNSYLKEPAKIRQIYKDELKAIKNP